MKPSLLVLAAGMGSRYGGLKQMDGLGPSGETIIDYSIYDAVESGFGKIVYVVRESFREQMEEAVKAKYAGLTTPDGEPVRFEFVVQELDRIPEEFTLNPERKKPWGTAHALLMARSVIHEPFVAINGDDFYGKDSFRIAGDWCRAHEDSEGEYALIGFKLDNTLSESGGVSRGICSYDGDGNLTDIVEHLNIALAEDGEVHGDNSVTGETGVILDKEALCSMNMWCFTPDYFGKSADIFLSFMTAFGDDLKKEFYIPYAVDVMMHADLARCILLSTPSRWFGVTFKEDRPVVVGKLAGLVAEGIYPTPLYKPAE